MQLALALYFDTNGVYPPSGGADLYPNNSWSNSAVPVSWDTSSAFQIAIAPYMPKLLVDPINQTGGWAGSSFYNIDYVRLTGYGCSSRAYLLVYKLENGSSTVSPGLLSCDGLQTFQYGGGALNTANANGIITIGVK